MYNPRFKEALKMYEDMTSRHVEELYTSKLIWKEIKDPDGYIIQIVPVVDMTFKF